MYIVLQAKMKMKISNVLRYLYRGAFLNALYDIKNWK